MKFKIRFVILIVTVFSFLKDTKAATVVPSKPDNPSNYNTPAPTNIQSKVSDNGDGPTPAVFKLPCAIDDDELLHEVGLFMRDSMNLSVDPCEDFYEFTCGNWMHNPRVPAKGHTDTFLHTIEMEINDLVVQYLKNYTKSATKSAEDKVKQFYVSCISSGKDLKAGVKTLLDTENMVYDKVNLTGESDWLAINFMSNYGIYALLPLSVNYSTTSRQFEISINLPYPELQIFYNNSRTEELFLVPDLDKNEFKLMIEFERNLTEKVSGLETPKRVTVAEFLHLHKADPISWPAVFKTAFSSNLNNGWYISNSIANFTKLERFLRKSSVSNMKNYIKWRTILKFYNIWKQELPNDENREQICRQHAEGYFAYAILPWFIEFLYDQERREDTLRLSEAIQTQFYSFIDNYSWLDDSSKSNMKTKLRSMDIAVGYKDEMRHVSLADRIYNEFDIGTDWFKNLQNLEANKARSRLHSVHKTVVPPMLSPFDVNAFYVDYINTVFITMAISQMPHYHIKFPESLKFGGLGMLIGHEIAHAFDPNGLQLDFDGKRQQWLTTQSQRNFKERYNCFENQYNKFIYRGIQTNGTTTMPDNIADNAGLRLAYHSLKTFLLENDNGDEYPLPGLNFTNNELFFIKFSQTWCTGRDEAYKMRHINSDHHAYGEFRVLGPLRNMPEFAKTFKCKLGSQMNPLKKCFVW